MKIYDVGLLIKLIRWRRKLFDSEKNIPSRQVLVPFRTERSVFWQFIVYFKRMRRQIPRERHFYMRSFCFLLITFLSYLFKLTGSNVHNFIVWLIVQWSVGEEERMKKEPLLSVSRSSWNCTDKSLCHLIACNAILVLFCSVVFLCRFCAQQFFVTFSIAFCSVWFAFARWMACHATQAAL